MAEYSDLDPNPRPVRPCVGCGQSDQAPRDQVSLPDGNVAYYHFDCHVLIADCTGCKLALAGAGGHGPDGKKNADLLEHIITSEDEIFTTNDVRALIARGGK